MDDQNQDNQKLADSTFSDPADAQEYQNILNQYADVISKEPVETASQSPVETPTTEDINPQDVLKEVSETKSPTIPVEEPLVHPSLNDNIEVDDEPKTSTVVSNTESEQLQPLTQSTNTISPPPRPSFDDQNFSTAPSSSSKINPFKISFIISLILFLGVGGIFLFFLFNPSQSNKQTTSINISPTPTAIVVAGSCELNDHQYQVGESFLSLDGCNTCTCESKNIISCTENTCLATTSAKPATKSATKNTPTPTKAATSSTKKVTPTPT